MKLLDLIHILRNCDSYDYCKLTTGEFINDKLYYSHSDNYKGVFVNTVLCDSCSFYTKYGNCDTNVKSIISINSSVIFETL